MNFTPLSLDGLVLIEQRLMSDERGAFARSFCEDTFHEAGLHADYPQHNHSFNTRAGTVRGMHYQHAPHEEVKLVQVLRGAIADVVVDIRKGSETFGQSLTVELSQDEATALYIPAGFAHGFQTLADDTLVTYLMGSRFVPDANTGFRWNDPAFDIFWPREISVISDKDLAYPNFGS
ncbi:dTDP-4-dehydrorhamnose 3,5-epimerase [Ahrensia sp. R2A130]|uniref:dTDP-4-dehydrorhamnose 3,5-epimerase n=1 Tax=Ahrensia sp. R2A130 TaxID=744979 RepID=UPI0001E0D8AE|nr:dTDP-4-dehydrorhamnose 3,5-epimerase [Ahrensia sp. R2A130]EFL87718.1 dTDP-4-dehydrorhamnose 3,5-epimerase [Ahrensia sp. R2A130]